MGGARTLRSRKKRGRDTMSAKPADGEAKPKKKLPMPIILGVVFMFVGIFVGKTVLGGKAPDAKGKGGKEKSHKEKGEKSEKSEKGDKEEAEGHFLPLDDFTVNLSGKGDHYLKTAISVKVPKEMTEEKFKEAVAPIRDAAVMTLSSKQLSEIGTPEGKEKLKEDLKAKMNEAAHEEDLVKEVCFTSFATQ